MEISHGMAKRGSLRFLSRRGFSSHYWITILSSLLCLFAGRASQAQTHVKNVLFVFSIVKYSDEMLSVMQPYMRAHYPGPINFYYAYLEDIQSQENPSWESQAEVYRRKYADVKMDVVIANVGPSLRFALKYREKIFPGVPIVFVSVNNRELEGQKIGPGVTGVTNPLGFKETIDLALRLHPDTKTIATIAGVTSWDSFWLQALHGELVRYQDKVKEIDVVGNPNRQMLERISALPPHTLVIFQMAPQFSDKPDFGTWDLLSEVAQRFPTYSVWPRFCVNGCVGGVFKDPVHEWKLTADLALRVLSGERADDIPIVHNSDLRPIVDWRELQRWHIPESALPSGSVILFRPPTLWEQGRKYFLAGIAVIAVEAVLIFALFWQRARRQKVEIELGKSEEKFSKAFRRSPLAITIIRATDGRYIEVNDFFEVETGWLRDEVLGRTPQEIGLWVDPDQRAAFLRQLLEKGNVKDFEVRLRRKNGQIRTCLGSAELIEVHGEQCALKVIADITERKQAEEAMASVSSRLIEAQEAERTRIARELHDDINQRLAMVAIIMESTKQDLPASEIETNRQLEKATAQISELGDDIQALAHRLHSPRLEYLGLEVAASGFCSEMSERQNVKVDFHCRDIPEGLSDQVSLCLFRVLQEALHNAVKYSGVDEFDVSLAGTSGEIELRVHDSGVGFDPKEISNGHGLGLVSMRERLKLVSGELSVDSKPGQGTTVLARVALDYEKTGPAEEKPLDLANQGVPQH